MTNAEDLQRRADELGDQLAALADQAGSKATRRLRSRLAVLRRDLLKAWMALFGTVAADVTEHDQAAAFAAAAAQLLTEAMDPALVDPDAVTTAWLTAYALGVGNAGIRAPSGLTPPQAAPPMDLQRPVTEQATRAAVGLTAAPLAAQGFIAVTVALARAEQAVQRIEATTAFELTRAAATGVGDVARATGSQLVWIAERDACVHCLAYAGVTTIGAVFPTGLTFGDRPLIPPGPLVGPPLHPHCRCALQVLGPSDTAVTAALKREAKRSVLRGFSLESESQAARLRAAARLLANGSGLPKSVEEYAGRAVRSGEFPRGREVPTGGRRP
ncbi:MAG: hypothetical protein ACRDSN_07590 [Pseudonocardiaceae bacterium]